MVVTLKKIAADCGVSTPTVSRILSGGGSSHSATTRRRVMQVAQELGYMPNTHARAMVSGRHGSIALVLTTREGPSQFLPTIIHGVEDVLSDGDTHLTIAKVPDERLCNDGFVPKLFREWLVDGLLVNYTYDIPGKMVDLIERHGLPAVWMNTQRPHDSVYQDNFLAARRATQRLIELGHRRIAYVDLSQGTSEMDQLHFSVVDRQRGFESEMRAAGLQPQVVRPLTGLGSDARLNAARQVLNEPDRPTAVVCFWLQSAMAIYLAAKSLGLMIPHDLSLITFSRPFLADTTGVDFSAMLDVGYEVARVATKQLMKKIEEPGLSEPSVRVLMAETAGSTVAPPAVTDRTGYSSPNHPDNRR